MIFNIFKFGTFPHKRLIILNYKEINSQDKHFKNDRD